MDRCNGCDAALQRVPLHRELIQSRGCLERSPALQVCNKGRASTKLRYTLLLKRTEGANEAGVLGLCVFETKTDQSQRGVGCRLAQMLRRLQLRSTNIL
jgi:hypothetical protein